MKVGNRHSIKEKPNEGIAIKRNKDRTKDNTIRRKKEQIKEGRRNSRKKERKTD